MFWRLDSAIEARTWASHAAWSSSLEPNWWMTSAALTPASAAILRTDAPYPDRAKRNTAASRIRARVVRSDVGIAARPRPERMFNILDRRSTGHKGVPAAGFRLLDRQLRALGSTTISLVSRE